jgi:hypothetical protein
MLLYELLWLDQKPGWGSEGRLQFWNCGLIKNPDAGSEGRLQFWMKAGGKPSTWLPPGRTRREDKSCEFSQIYQYNSVKKNVTSNKQLLLPYKVYREKLCLNRKMRKDFSQVLKLLKFNYTANSLRFKTISDVRSHLGRAAKGAQNTTSRVLLFEKATNM